MADLVHRYIGTLFHGIAALAAICRIFLLRSYKRTPTHILIADYLPVYFQASLGASAVGSGVDMFALVLTIPPFAVLTGLSVQIVNCYRPQNYVGWILMIIGFGVLSILDENSSRAMYIGCQIPVAVGLGLIWVGTQFPILAPLPFSNSAHALSFFTFVRCFAQVRRIYQHFLPARADPQYL